MKNLNNKGFTLIEVLAVVVIISLLTGIVVPNIIKTMNSSKESAYKIMVDNIVTASIELFEELDNYTDGDLEVYQYDDSGFIASSKNFDFIEDNTAGKIIYILDTNLQTLVSNGFLEGTSSDENEIKKLINPVTKENIGFCEIRIKKTVSTSNYKVSYMVESIDDAYALGCPSDDEYLNGVK